MLKIITSVVLSLVTIMAVTLFAVTVPGQSQKIDENAAAIQSNETYIKTVDDALENLQEAFDILDAKKIYLHSISISASSGSTIISLNLINRTNTEINTYQKLKDSLETYSDNHRIYYNVSGYYVATQLEGGGYLVPVFIRNLSSTINIICVRPLTSGGGTVSVNMENLTYTIRDIVVEI